MIVEKQVVANNISRLINQVWKLIPMRENNENWKKQIDCLLVEMRGLQALFSEDLDFQVTRDDYKLNFDQCMSKCLNVLESYGLKFIVHSKPEYDSCEVRRRYIKISHYYDNY